MASSAHLSSSPHPGPSASLEESLRYYKAQYESLESELADFQASSKELEAELERDVEASEKRERHLKEKASNLQYEVDEWKGKYKQAKTESGSAQNALQKEITELRDTNRTLQMRLRDIEVANDDYERQQRNTESSLEDMESKYNQSVERGVLLEEEVRSGEQEREALRIEAQRLKDELSDLKIETDITKGRLAKAEDSLARRGRTLTLRPIDAAPSPRSELSPTTTNTSSKSFDTPPPKTASSSAVSDTPTPPSPPVSDKLTNFSKPLATSTIAKSRMSIGNQTAQRQQPMVATKPNGHTRGVSSIHTRPAPPTVSRPPTSRLSIGGPRPGLPQSSSIIHLRNLRGKMQKLEERVQTVRSKLPGPTNTPPKASPRPGSALGSNVPDSVTVRSRKRVGGSTINGLSADESPSKPRPMTSRQSLRPTQQPSTPGRGDMAAPPARPSSRASAASRPSLNPYVPGHSRPGSRASISARGPLGGGTGSNFAPNASTDRVRPKSALSNHGYDGSFDVENDESILEEDRHAGTPTPRRTTFGKRTSDVGSSIPSPSKRTSLGGASKVPAIAKRQSMGFGNVELRTPSRQALNDVQETYDVNETF